MTTSQRAYINKKFNQYVDDECLQFRSVPMAVTNQILKPKVRKFSDFTGVKRIFNNVPARPINLNALATSIARMNGMDYSKVESISRQIGLEEVRAVNQFVKKNKDPFEIPMMAPQKYVAEEAVISTTGVALTPSLYDLVKNSQPNIGYSKEVQLLLGDEAMTYNSPPLKPRMVSTGSGMTAKQRLIFENMNTLDTSNVSTQVIPTTRTMGSQAAVRSYTVGSGMTAKQRLEFENANTPNTSSMGTNTVTMATKFGAVKDETRLNPNYKGLVKSIESQKGLPINIESEYQKFKKSSNLRKSYTDETGISGASGTTVYSQVGHTTKRMDSIFGAAKSED